MGNSEEGGPITGFPADDLRNCQRFITSHDENGREVFIRTDHGDHHRVMVQGKGVANIIYSTNENPVDLKDEEDVRYAAEHEASPYILPRQLAFQF